MKICAYCGKEFEPSKYGSHAINCSPSCTRKYARRRAVELGIKKEQSKRWADKHREQKRSMDLDYHNRTAFDGLKYDVLKRDDYKCQECGCDQVGRLIIHHIDEDKQHNEMPNLVTLCRACHAKVHHTGELNPLYKEISKEDVVNAIASTKNLEEASRLLGITRKTLNKKRQMYGLPALDKHGRPKGSLL